MELKNKLEDVLLNMYVISKVLNFLNDDEKSGFYFCINKNGLDIIAFNTVEIKNIQKKIKPIYEDEVLFVQNAKAHIGIN